MRFVKFFKELREYFLKTDNLDYIQIKKILAILYDNMNDKEQSRNEYWIFKSLTAITKQLKITHFKNGSVKIE